MKIRRIISIVLIMLLVVATKVYAVSDTFNTTLRANKTSVERGDSVTITIGLKDIAITSGEKGIGAYTAKLEFDSSVLEYDSSNSTSKWEAPFYQDKSITGNTKNGEVIKTTQDIGTIKFKVKNNAKLGETTIKLTNFLGSTVEKDVLAPNKSIKVVIKDKVNNNENNNNVENNNTTNNNVSNGNTTNTNNNSANSNTNNSSNGNKKPSNVNNTNKVTNNSNNKVNDNTIKNGKLPQTGTTDMIIFALMGICSILAIIFFVRIKFAK